MGKDECIRFLKWALPRLQMRWGGFRKVHNQVCKRIYRRMEELELEDYRAYREYLEDHEEEWEELDKRCIITISRFYRDWAVFDELKDRLLPESAERASSEGRPLRCWSAGCASGEEPYTLSLIFHFVLEEQFPELEWEIVATDLDGHMLKRARRACYTESSFKNLPDHWVEKAFEKKNAEYCLRKPYKENVELLQQDIREEQPEGPFDVILCRYLVGTYYEKYLQIELYRQLAGLLAPGGLLVLGSHEEAPGEVETLDLFDKGKQLYRLST